MSIRLEIDTDVAYLEGKNTIFKTIDEFSISKKLQNHSHLKVGGFVDFDEQKTLNLLDDFQNKDISFHWCYDTINPDSYIQLFYGAVNQVRLSQRGNRMYCELTANSVSAIMDIEKKIRIFQDDKKTYNDLFNELMSDYKTKIRIEKENFFSSKIDNIIIQYNETDWEFLLRIGRRIGTLCFLTGDEKSGRIFFSNGDIEELNSNYFSISNNNYNEEIVLESRMFYKLGNQLKFKNKVYTITEINHFYKNATIYNSYTLKDKDFNSTYSGLPMLNGLILKAIVKENIDDCNKGRVKIEFCEDGNIKDMWKSSHYFDVKTSYSSDENGKNVGFYSIPEKNEVILVNFFSDYESDCIISGVVREKENDFLKDPSQKIWRNNKGREFRINDNEISVSSKDEKVFLKLSDELIKCTNDETSLEVSKDKTKLTYKDSEILLDGNEIKLQVGKAFIKVNKNGVEINDGKSANIEVNKDINISGSNANIKTSSNIKLEGSSIKLN